MSFLRSHRAAQRQSFRRNQCSMIGPMAMVYPLLILISAGGCGVKKRLEVFPVHGRVTYAGQGVPHAVVIFVPTGDTAELLNKMRPFAYADGTGNFTLKTYVDGDGAPAGKYRVCVVAAPGVPNPSQKDRPPAERPASAGAVSIPAAVSKKYGSADTSGIEATVVEGENNLEPFVLSAGGKT